MKKVLFCTKLTEDNKNLRDYILRVIGKYKTPADSSLLEIGVGNGRFGFLMGDRFKKYCGIEPDKEYLSIAKKSAPYPGISYKLGSAEKIPYKTKFDILFYSFSWHMLKNHEAALSEAKRVLKDDGLAIIIDPIENSPHWADSRLNRTSADFNEKMYNKKMSQIKSGIEDLNGQKYFEIVQFDSGRINFWVLKKGKNA